MSVLAEFILSLTQAGMSDDITTHDQKRFRVMNIAFLIGIAICLILTLFYVLHGAHSYVWTSIASTSLLIMCFVLRIIGYTNGGNFFALLIMNIVIFMAEYSFPVGSDIHLLYLLPLATLFLAYEPTEWRYISFFTIFPLILHTIVLITEYVPTVLMAGIIVEEKSIPPHVMAYLSFVIAVLGVIAFVIVYANENYRTEKILERQVSTIREQEQKLSSILNAIPDPIWLIDTNYTVYVGNEAMARHNENRTGYRLAIGAVVSNSIYTPEELRMWQAKYSSAFAGNYESFEYTSVYSDGRRWFAITVAPVVIANRITGAVGILRDITAIKRTQQGIIRSEANLKAVISSLDDIIFQINKEHQIENVWTSDHYAFSNVGELIGKSVAPFFYQASQQVSSAIDMVFATHKPQSVEFYIEQMRRWYRAKILYVMISGKETVTVLLADVSSRKQYEQEILNLNGRLTQLNENLEERVAERTQELKSLASELQNEVRIRTHAEERLSVALEREHLFSEMKTRLVTLLSHQFRTPLTYIQSGADIIEHSMRTGRTLLPEQINKYLEGVYVGTEQIVNLIDNVSRLMDVQTAILQDDAEDFNLTDLVQNIVKEFNYSDDLHGLEAIERVRISAPALLNVHTVQLAIRAAVQELLKNALTYSLPKTPISIDIVSQKDDSLTNDEDEITSISPQIEIRITNMGYGIAPNEIESVFEYFYRSGEHDAVGKSRGLGIGLGLVKFCAEAVRGSVRLDTDLTEKDITKETTFTFIFPQNATL